MLQLVIDIVLLNYHCNNIIRTVIEARSLSYFFGYICGTITRGAIIDITRGAIIVITRGVIIALTRGAIIALTRGK